MREKGVALEDGVQRSFVRRQFGYVFAVKGDYTAVRGKEARNETQKGGFAAA